MLTCTIQFSSRFTPRFSSFSFFFFLWVQIFSNVRTLSAIGICVPVVVVSFPSLLSCSTYLLLSWEMQFDSRINPWVFGVHADCVLCVHCERNVANQCYVSALCKLTRFPHANTVDNSIVFLFSYIRIRYGQCFHIQKACFLPFKAISRAYQTFRQQHTRSLW